MPVSPTIASRSNGQTIDQTWFNVLKTAADDHEDRIAAIEGEIFSIPFLFQGYYSDLTMPFTTQMIVQPNFAIILLDFEVIALTAGSGGTLEVDIKHNESGSFVSCLSTKPTVAAASGNLATSTNGVVNSLLDEVSANKLIRLDITNKQTGGAGFLARLTAARN